MQAWSLAPELAGVEAVAVPPTFLCPRCPQTFRFKVGLDRHLKLTHNIQLPYSCTICPGVYRYRKNLYMHMRKAHGVSTTDSI